MICGPHASKQQQVMLPWQCLKTILLEMRSSKMCREKFFKLNLKKGVKNILKRAIKNSHGICPHGAILPWCLWSPVFRRQEVHRSTNTLAQNAWKNCRLSLTWVHIFTRVPLWDLGQYWCWAQIIWLPISVLWWCITPSVTTIAINILQCVVHYSFQKLQSQHIFLRMCVMRPDFWLS